MPINYGIIESVIGLAALATMVMLFIGYKNSSPGKNLNMSNITFTTPI